MHAPKPTFIPACAFIPTVLRMIAATRCTIVMAFAVSEDVHHSGRDSAIIGRQAARLTIFAVIVHSKLSICPYSCSRHQGLSQDHASITAQGQGHNNI
eukprot:scaffold8774_cov19-Tisochrysis_lutea.AAC.3